MSAADDLAPWFEPDLWARLNEPQRSVLRAQASQALDHLGRKPAVAWTMDDVFLAERLANYVLT